MTLTDEFRQAMRGLAGAVNIVTTGKDRRSWRGLTATAVCSLSADPPRLLVCVNKTASAHKAITENHVFAVNVLSHSLVPLANLFANNEAISQRFEQGDWSIMATGSPILDGCVANFDCELKECIDSSTHSIFVGNVVATAAHTDNPPLLYFDGAYRDIQSTE